MLECHECNLERWMIAKCLQANEINTNNMYDFISCIAWDTSLLTDAMQFNASNIQSFIVNNKKVKNAMKENPKQTTHTSLKAWRESLHTKVLARKKNKRNDPQ